MSLSEIAVPTFVRLLGSLSGFLDKAAAHAEAKKIDPAVLLGTRLFPDMFPLARQVQLASDFAKGTMARLAGSEPPKYADEEKTFEELKARLAKTIEFIKSLDQAVISAAADKDYVPGRWGHTADVKGQGLFGALRLAEFLFSRDHRLQHPPPLRRRAG